MNWKAFSEKLSLTDAPKTTTQLQKTYILQLNGTLSHILKISKDGTEILVTGPTASMLPEVLFENGVTMTCGIIVTDADELLDVISEAGSGYHFFGKSGERAVVKKKLKLMNMSFIIIFLPIP